MNRFLKSITIFLVIFFSVSTVSAATLSEKLKDGHKLRLGFGTAVPWAYAGDNGEALGFVNMIALLQILAGILLFSNKTRLFGLLLLLPIIFNIFFMHVYFDDRMHENVETGILLAINLILILYYQKTIFKLIWWTFNNDKAS